MFVQGDRSAPDRNALDIVISQLRLGMPLFFVLSGFLIFRPFVAAALEARHVPDLGRYATRRAARIVPAYWAAILIPAAALALLGHGEARPVEQLPVFLLFLQNYNPVTANHLNPPTWTIVVEVSFYIVVPLIAIVGAWVTARFTRLEARRTVLAIGCVVLLLVGAYVLGQCALNGPNHTPLKDSLLGRLASFAAGMLAAVLVHGRSVGRPPATILAGVGVALVALEGTVRGLSLGSADLRDIVVDTPASIGFALLVAGLALSQVPGEKLLSRGPLRWYGKYSYGLYLWHFPVIYALRSLGWWPDSLPEAIVATMVPATALAVVSWWLLEKPAIDWAHRRTTPTRRRTQAIGAPITSGD